MVKQHRTLRVGLARAFGIAAVALVTANWVSADTHDAQLAASEFIQQYVQGAAAKTAPESEGVEHTQW